MRRISALAKQLAGEDENHSDFAYQLVQLANRFEERAVMELVDSYASPEKSCPDSWAIHSGKF